MRISSLQIFEIARKSLSDVNESVVKTQEQMSTGKRVLTPADDPVASTKILQITDELAAIEQYKKNIDIAENNLVLEESILKNVTSVIQRMQELSVAAGNTASLTEAEYRAMASEVEERMDELLNLLNTQNANGDFIFGGYKSKTPPFEGNAQTGFNFLGNAGQQSIKVANGTVIKANDSGKTLFMDVNSDNRTVQTKASPDNSANPPASISVGQVVDQAIYDDFYPEDIIITFNPDSNISPPGKNFTATERSTGRIIVENQRHASGNEIELEGVSFRIVGDPVSGIVSTPATLAFGTAATPGAFDFSAPNEESFTLTVRGQTETLILDANITSVADLVTVLNDPVNGNAAKLNSLGISVDSQGFSLPQGVNFSIASGTANIDTVMGFDTTNGITSSDGVQESPGDRFFIESTEKQGLLTTLARFHNAMANFDGSAESKREVSDVVASTLNNLGNAQNSVLDVVSKIGARLNTLSSSRESHLDTELISKEVLSKLRDVDYAEAATRLSQQTLILQAAQQSFVRVSQLNLFSRL